MTQAYETQGTRKESGTSSEPPDAGQEQPIERPRVDEEKYLKRVLDAFGHMARRRKTDPLVGIIREKAERGETLGVLRASSRARKVVLVLLACVLLAAAAWAVTTTVRSLLHEAAELRGRLDALGEAIGLDSACETSFAPAQPDTVHVEVSLDPQLVSSAKLSWDGGETWTMLYDSRQRAAVSPGPVVHVVETRTFDVPTTEERTIEARVRVAYSSDVVAAFPIFGQLEKTDHVGRFRLGPTGIEELTGGEPGDLKPGAVVATVPLSVMRWEITNDPDANLRVENDPDDNSLVQRFRLPNDGDWTNLSTAIPGARPSCPLVSVEGVTAVQLDILYARAGDAPITLEAKLVDAAGRIVGYSRPVMPYERVRTIRIPLQSMKPWFGHRGFDYSRVARLELAIARKGDEQAASGVLSVLHIDLLGKEELPPPFDIEQGVFTTLVAPALDAARWQTARSKRGKIELSDEGGTLVCAIELPFDPERDEELPWTNLRLELEEPERAGLRDLQVVELELQFEGEPEGAPVTIEPKLVMGGHVYGTHRRVYASADPQRVAVGLHELKYYYAEQGADGEPRMDLDKLTAFGLGVSRKGQDQAARGALHITAIRLLGPKSGSSND